MLPQSLYQQLLQHLEDQKLLTPDSRQYAQNLSIKDLHTYQLVAQDQLYPLVAHTMNIRYVIPDQNWMYLDHQDDAVLAQYQHKNWLIMVDPWDVEIIDTMRQRQTVHHIALGTPSHIQQLIHKANAIKNDDMWTQLLDQAITCQATDIHFLQDQHMIRVQFRIHGLLKDHSMISREQWTYLINQIKIRALLDITENRRAQTGQISGIFAGHMVHCRIAIHPTILGETVTVRILYQQHQIATLDLLGFQNPMIHALNHLIEAPAGLFLITGPTGSGKTTTLYSLFKNHVKHRKIMTLEDPVEYQLPPIQQTDIRHHDIFSYHDGLKSILRHDPDIIFVGEIRDTQTAQLTLQAAMTGHLVCATTHTHTAIDALYRFLDFGISQAALGTQLLGILTQKLHPNNNTLKLQAELLLCDPPLRKFLLSHNDLKGVESFIHPQNFLKNHTEFYQ